MTASQRQTCLVVAEPVIEAFESGFDFLTSVSPFRTETPVNSHEPLTPLAPLGHRSNGAEMDRPDHVRQGHARSLRKATELVSQNSRQSLHTQTL